LKTRCKAIQNALRTVNQLGKPLGRPELEWKDVSTYGTLAEFELLRECREDIRRFPWTDSANRQAAIYSLKMERAHEERCRLDIEIVRLVNWMADEENELRAAIVKHELNGSPLTCVLKEMLARRARQNSVHRNRIFDTMALPSYTGKCDLHLFNGNFLANSNDQDQTDDQEIDDDASAQQLTEIEEYIGRLHV
jgi:hypothetical protein